MVEAFFNYINGQWVASKSGETIDSINPANQNEIVGTVQSSNVDDLNDAVQSARQAFPMWKKMSPVERGHFLHRAADIMVQKSDEIAAFATREMGKTLAETKGEVARAVTILRYYAQEGMRKIGDLIPSQDSKNLMFTTRVPLGVVSVISPWNFPIAIPIWKLAPALVYGNTIVFKPATETAVTAAKLVEVFAEAGLPAGVLNLVTGKGSVIGNEVIEHPGVNAITFTGSNEVGKQVALGAVARGAKYQLEMGGKNPAIILEDADLDVAVELSVNGAMKSAGQKCTATSRVFIQKSIYNETKERILQKVKSITVGSGLQEGIYMGPLASRSQRDTVWSYIQKGIEEGAALLYGGKLLVDEPWKDGFFIQPTLFEQVTNEMTIAREEIFGPVLCMIPVENLEDALKQANDTPFGLSASLFTRDISKSLQFIDDIEAGMIKINGESAGVEPQAPFGGMKASSSHSREQGQAAMEFFTSIKTITITPTP